MSCLFNSLSKFVNVKPNNLRENICNFLEKNPILITGDDRNITNALCVADIIPNELSTYLSKMRNSNTWGGGIEIKAFCEIYNYQVNVHIPNNIMIPFYPIGLPLKIINISWTGNHFIPN